MKKILILCPTRTGSNYIYATIARHLKHDYTPFKDNLDKFHLLYNNLAPEQVQLTIDQFLDQFVNSKLAIAKLHVSGLFTLSDYNLLDKFKSADFYTIVTLRRDLVQAAISHARTHVTKEWVKYKTTHAPMALTQEQLLVGLNSTTYQISEILNNKFKLNYNEIVYYEDITGVPEQDIKKLKIYTPDLFGPEKPAPVYPERSPNKEETLLNYNELVESSLEFFDNWIRNDTQIAERITINDGKIMSINVGGLQ
jgi:hypothetical protein